MDHSSQAYEERAACSAHPLSESVSTHQVPPGPLLDLHMRRIARLYTRMPHAVCRMLMMCAAVATWTCPCGRGWLTRNSWTALSRHHASTMPHPYRSAQSPAGSSWVPRPAVLCALWAVLRAHGWIASRRRWQLAGSAPSTSHRGNQLSTCTAHVRQTHTLSAIGRSAQTWRATHGLLKTLATRSCKRMHAFTPRMPTGQHTLLAAS